MAAETSDGTRLRHPNRERASARATQLFIAALLVASSALIAIVLIGGWTAHAGARWMTAAFVIVYALMAYYVLRWKRGVLAMSAGLSLLFALMVIPTMHAWFERTKDGYETPLLPAEILGLLTVLIVLVQLLLAVASIVGFNQGWDLEIEERSDAHDDYEDDYEDYDDEPDRGEPAPAQ